MIQDTIEYKLIVEYYGNQTAHRSGVPLINHINEGLKILNMIDASEQAKRAYCLHPLLQNDADLKQNYIHVANVCDSSVVMFAMEYRSVANEFLSGRMDHADVIYRMSKGGTEAVAELIRLSPIKDVNDMLIADKVQNYKDFIAYHSETHARKVQLDDYFRVWIHRLGVDHAQCNILHSSI